MLCDGAGNETTNSNMNLIPNPLHPALVHFPIVLIVLGSAAALVAVFWRGGHVPRYAALLLAMGAFGCWVAMETGESDGGLLEKAQPKMAALVDAHEEWAERTLTAAIIAAVLVTASAFTQRWPKAARGLAVAGALASLAAGYAVYETGHRGGALVFRHGAGVTVADGGLITAETRTALAASSRVLPRD